MWGGFHMTNYVKVGRLQVADVLYHFINEKALPETQVEQAAFWDGFEKIIYDLQPKNKVLLQKRDEMQEKLDQWYNTHKGNYDFNEYRSFLEEIGYLEKEVSDFKIGTQNVDYEIAAQPGPQLVVPGNNARYAINAVNARWGSLYDALYGTDAISESGGAERKGTYNPVRGQKVIDFAKEFLDQAAPLAEGSHKEITAYTIQNGKLVVTLENGTQTGLKDAAKLKGYQGDAANPDAILLENHRLHFEIQIDKNHQIGATDLAGVKDILMEAAVTTIMDCEDSVTAVDAVDKTLVYENWLGVMKGNISASFTKGKKEITRTLNPDRSYISPDGVSFQLSGRSLLFIRSVGHLMSNSAILLEDGSEIQEGIMDQVICSLIGKHTLLGNGPYQNTKEGSIYIVKPKMHGSEEVAFANELFNRTEDLLGLERYTIKIGVMDEERRTSLNLKNCIAAVKDRVVFINTGFLDRTGDEIHTSMEAGPMIRKNDMKSSVWLAGYEKNNVNVGLGVGFQGVAQIGKGMWAMPDAMAAMLEQKIGHLKAGGNTAWVPSPTAAVLHALHYHQMNVLNVQDDLMKQIQPLKDDILQVPVAKEICWTEDEILEELNNNAQSILGYVVRWVDQGIGCSKVPDYYNVPLMEDRATLRISSQHMANWLRHGVCTKEQVMTAFREMAKVVDKQNEGDAAYTPMAKDYDNSVSFQAALDLVFKGCAQPNGYTEPILHQKRIEFKAKHGIQ